MGASEEGADVMFTPIVSPDFQTTAKLLDSERLGRAMLDASFALRFMMGKEVPDWCRKHTSLQMLDLWRDQTGLFHIPSLVKYLRDLNQVFFKRAGRHCVAFWDNRELHRPWQPTDGLLRWSPVVHQSHLMRVVSKDQRYFVPRATELNLKVDEPVQPYYKVVIEYGHLS